MSGGSYGYQYRDFEDEYAGRMYDEELNLLVKDLAVVLHDVEWWQSSDISEKKYRETVEQFKKKWLGGAKCRSERMKEIIDAKCEGLRAELLRLTGMESWDYHRSETCENYEEKEYECRIKKDRCSGPECDQCTEYRRKERM